MERAQKTLIQPAVMLSGQRVRDRPDIVHIVVERHDVTLGTTRTRVEDDVWRSSRDDGNTNHEDRYDAEQHVRHIVTNHFLPRCDFLGV